MPRIDAHVHVFKKDCAEFPRESNDLAPPEREAPVERLLDTMEANRIDQAVLVQFGGAHYEQHAYLLHCLERYPDRFRGIGLIPDDVVRTPEDHMDRLVDDTGIIGFRLKTLGGPADAFEDIDVRSFASYPIWRHAAEKNYVLWLYVRAADAFQIPYLIEAFPQVRVVLNHLGVCPGEGKTSVDELGRPRHPLPGYQIETNSTFRLYGYENLTLLFSGHYAFSKEAYPYADLSWASGFLFKIFGPERMMWASDFPWPVDDPGYTELSNLVDELLPDIGPAARAQIMGDTAASWLQFPG